MIKENVVRALQLANPWWEGKSIPSQYDLPYKKRNFSRILGFERLGRIVVIKGPRRTGKTTLMYQYIDTLLQKKIQPEQIMFASMDDLNLRVDLQDLLDFQETVVTDFNRHKKRYVFIDEIQFLDNWSTMAKLICDRDKSVRLIVSGSSASLLIKSSESLAGRSIEELVLPFAPREVAAVSQRQSMKELTTFFKKNPLDEFSKLRFAPSWVKFKPSLERLVNQYLERGGLPHLFSIKEKTTWLELLRTDIIQKAIYKDLVDLYELNDPVTLERLFLYLVEATSGIVNLSSVAGQLKLSRETTKRYMQYLINAYLVLPTPKYSNYPKEILKSQEKLHIMDPAFSWLTGGFDKARVLESVVVSLLKQQQGARLYYWRKNYEVDVVIDTGRSLVPVEIKLSGQKFSPINYRGLINFMKKYKVGLGYVVYQGEAEEIKLGGGMIRMLPAWYVLANL